MKAGALSHLVEAATALGELDGPNVLLAPSLSSERIVEHPNCANKKSINRNIFPTQLMNILSDSSLSDVISWLPHGKSFVIIRPDIFTDSVLPSFLATVDCRASTKYPSFTRKLNRW
jgi:HSF-type DNA-binding